MKDWRHPEMTDAQHTVAYSFGAGTPTYWAGVVRRQRDRIEASHHRLVAAVFDQAEPLEPTPGNDLRYTLPYEMTQDACLMVFAADLCVRLAERLCAVASDAPSVADLRDAIDHLRREFPHLKSIRDSIAHVEDYGIGMGRATPGLRMDGPSIRLTGEGLSDELILSRAHYDLAVYALASAVEAVQVADDRAFWTGLAP